MKEFRIALVLVTVGLLGLLLFVFAQSYEGRKNVIVADRVQCRRAVNDRVLLIRSDWPHRDEPATRILVVAYARQIPLAEAGELPAPLRRFADFSCARAFPAASVWP